MTKNECIAANEILSGTDLGIVDAARIALEAVELLGSSIERIREGMRLAAAELQKREQTVPFGVAVDAAIRAKAHRRPRTLADIRQLTSRMMRSCPELGIRPLRSLSPEDCQEILERSFETPRQRLKGRMVLSGIFSIASKRGWCGENPVMRVDPPVIREQQIMSLKLHEVERLMAQAGAYDNGSCAPAVGLMVYAGIRPREIERLTWNDIDLTEGVVSLTPSHTKTGGARHVTILPVLGQLLRERMARERPGPDTPVCPKNWRKRWIKVRMHAGWNPGAWQQDCLRHTYASYHAKHFRDYTRLQWEMGHRSPDLLRTRYLNMTGITSQSAARFWLGAGLGKSPGRTSRHMAGAG